MLEDAGSENCVLPVQVGAGPATVPHPRPPGAQFELTPSAGPGPRLPLLCTASSEGTTMHVLGPQGASGGVPVQDPCLQQLPRLPARSPHAGLTWLGDSQAQGSPPDPTTTADPQGSRLRGLVRGPQEKGGHLTASLQLRTSGG